VLPVTEEPCRRSQARDLRTLHGRSRKGHFATLPSVSAFERAVLARLRALRPGEVVTYAEVAEEAGFAGAARAVGNILARSEGLPWWRVVTADGRLVPGHEAVQARKLRAEGVAIRSGRVVRAATPPGGRGTGTTARSRPRSR
jgi:methylated-DNA-protein-cysteine methyltransferase related protein